ncbi:MAG: SxtJ family membrane protein [Acidobacteriota bacterium]
MLRLDTRPTTRQLRSFALLWWPLFCAALGFGLWRFGLPSAILPLVGVAAGLAVVGALAPPLIRPLFVGLLLVTYPIGWVLSHLVLLVAYYLVLTPVGLGLRLFGRDPLFPGGRDLDKAESIEQTRWHAWRAPEGRTRYFRQY